MKCVLIEKSFFNLKCTFAVLVFLTSLKFSKIRYHISIITASIEENVKMKKEKRFIVIVNKPEQFCIVSCSYCTGLFFGLMICRVLKKKKILKKKKKKKRNKKKKNIYLCNCSFDTGLVSLQLNDIFTGFISKCKLGLQSGFWFHKNNNDFYAVCLKFDSSYLIEFDAYVYWQFFDDICNSVELYEKLNFDEHYIVINWISVFDNSKNDKMYISNFCELCKV